MANSYDNEIKEKVNRLFNKFRKSKDINDKKFYVNKLIRINNYKNYLSPDNIIEIIIYL